MTDASVTVLGLGRMGAALAGCFVRAGHGVTVWNRNLAKTSRFRDRASIAATAAEACSASDLIAVCVTDYSASFELLDAAASTHALLGKVLVQFTRGSASDAKTMDAWARANEMHYIDAALLGTPGDVGNDAMVFFAGDERAFDTHHHTLLCLGRVASFVGGSVGAAATLDCALLDYYYGANVAMLHGAALCQSEDFPLDVYFDAVRAFTPSLADGATAGQDAIARADYLGQGTTLDMHLATMRHIQRMTHDNHLETKFIDAVVDAGVRAVRAQCGAEELAAIFKSLRQRRSDADDF